MLYDSCNKEQESFKMTITYENHTIVEFVNENGLTKYEVTKVGETKMRGMVLTLDAAKNLAKMYNY